MKESGEVKRMNIKRLNELIDYIPGSVACKNILSKTTGKISIMAIDAGVTLPLKTIQFEIFNQIVEGKATLIIDNEEYQLSTNHCITIPAHTPNKTKAGIRFKMIQTIIKSGYEEISNNGII